MEYEIRVTMTPHEHDSLNTPYFWCVMRDNGQGWCNGGFGWATSPEKAWKQANEYYESFEENNNGQTI